MNFLKNLLLALALSLPLYVSAGEPVNINTADAAAIADNLNRLARARHDGGGREDVAQVLTDRVVRKDADQELRLRGLLADPSTPPGERERLGPCEASRHVVFEEPPVEGE